MVWNLVGLGVGVVGIVVAVALYVRSHERVRLLHRVQGQSLVDPGFLEDDLEIRLRGKVVPRVSWTSITLWNDGNSTLERSAVAERDPLRVELADAALLGWGIKVNRAVTGLAVSGGSDAEGVLTMNLDFDFLDPGDGARIDVMHTGNPEAASLRGTVKGPRAATERVWPGPMALGLDRIPWLGSASVTTVMAVVYGWALLVVAAGVAGIAGWVGGDTSLAESGWMLVISGLGFAGIGAILAPSLRRRGPRDLEIT